jgi:hypothetical protein
MAILVNRNPNTNPFSQVTRAPQAAPTQNAFAGLAPDMTNEPDTRGGFGAGMTGSTPASGPLNASERAAVNAISGNVPGAVAGYFGASPAVQVGANILGNAFNPSPTAPLGMVNAFSSLATLLGAQRETNPMFGVPSSEDVQNAYDYGGFNAGQAATSARSSALGNLDSPFGLNPSFSYGNDFGAAAGSPGGWGGAPSAPESSQPSAVSPSTSAEGRDTGPGGADMGPGSASGGPGGIGSDAGQGSDHGADWARGGISQATRGPKSATYGEAGPETAAFVPHAMFAPGMQGREPQVRAGLRDLLMKMRG